MKIKTFMLKCLFVLCLLAQPTAAGQLEDGVAAYNRAEYATAIQLLRPLAHQGDGVAQIYLGAIYYEGRGIPPDYAEAARWYKVLADKGFSLAQYTLGYMYSTGQGVPLDYSEAAKLYRLAADNGYAPAQYALGLRYSKGEHVPQDFVQAHMWFNLAAAGSDAYRKTRDEFSGFLTPDQIDEAQRLAREWTEAHPTN